MTKTSAITAALVALCGASPAPAQALPTSIDVEHLYAALGVDIGRGGIAVSDALGPTEIYLASRDLDSRWMALRHVPGSGPGKYVTEHVSEPFPSRVAGLAVGRMMPGPALQVVVLREDGILTQYDQASRSEVATFPVGQSGINRMRLYDLDGDGIDEVISITSSDVKVFRGNGVQLAHYPGVGGSDVLAAEMDGDPSPEIVASDGYVIDYYSGIVQWSWPGGFASRLAAHDLDGDGDAELFAGSFLLNQPPAAVVAFDVALQRAVWKTTVHNAIDALEVFDADGDGVDEVVVGTGIYRDVVGLDLATGAQLWRVRTESDGVHAMACADLDADGRNELVWGMGYASSGSDRLYVAEPARNRWDWASLEIDAPFSRPAAADVDGDGNDEYYVGTWDGWHAARVLALDAALSLRQATPAVGGGAGGDAQDVAGADLDGDGRDEVVVASSRSGRGLLQAFGDPGTGRLAAVWENADQPQGMAFARVLIEDVDADGALDLVVGSDPSGGNQPHLLWFDYPAGNELWRSLALGSSNDPVSDLLVHDLDNDGVLDIVAVVEGGDAWIFDGMTRNLKGLVAGPWLSAAAWPSGPGLPDALLLGSPGGIVARYEHTGFSWQQTASWAMATAPVDGLSVVGGDLWVGAGGRLQLHPAPLGALPLLDSQLFQPPMGGRVLALPSGDLLTTGRASVVLFSLN